MSQVKWSEIEIDKFLRKLNSFSHSRRMPERFLSKFDSIEFFLTGLRPQASGLKPLVNEF